MGIILAGLEWSEQHDELQSLVDCAKAHSLQIIIYTGLNDEKFHRRVPKDKLVGCYVKYGNYDERYASNNYCSFGVKLASTNQYIAKFMQ